MRTRIAIQTDDYICEQCRFAPPPAGRVGIRFIEVADRNRLRRQALLGAPALAVLVAAVLHIVAPVSATQIAAPQASSSSVNQSPVSVPSPAGPVGLQEAPKTSNYSIDVSLDPATRTITGSEAIT